MSQRLDEYSDGYLHPGAVLHPFAPDGQFAISMADWGYESSAGGHHNSAPHFFVPHYSHIHPAEMQVPLQRKMYPNGANLDGVVIPLLSGLRVLEDTESTTRRVLEFSFLEGMQMLKTLQMAEFHFISSGPRAQFPFVKSIPMLSTMPAQMLPFSLPSFNPAFQALQPQMIQPQMLQPLQSSMQQQIQQQIQLKAISHPGDIQLMQMQEIQAFNPVQHTSQSQQLHAPSREHKHKSQSQQNSGNNSNGANQLKDMYAPVCLDFVKGVCSQKRACCKFAHPPQMNIVANLVSPTPSGEGRSVCALWMLTGTCKFGDRCRDLHVPLNEQPSSESSSEGNRIRGGSTVAPIPHAPVIS